MNELTTVLETGVEVAGTERTFKSKKLAQQTKAIEKLMLSTKKNMYEIAVRLAVIKHEKLYEADGFKDEFDYANQILGYHKPMVYKMIQVAENLIAVSEDGKSYHSVFYLDGTTEDYTVSQLMELNSISVDEAKELNDSCAISPDMTTKDIRATVKDFKAELKGGVADEKSDNEDTSDSSADTVTEDVDTVETETIADVAFNSLEALVDNLKILLDETEDMFTVDVREKMESDLTFYAGLSKSI